MNIIYTCPFVCAQKSYHILARHNTVRVVFILFNPYIQFECPEECQDIYRTVYYIQFVNYKSNMNSNELSAKLSLIAIHCIFFIFAMMNMHVFHVTYKSLLFLSTI
eukprot:527802_1